MLETNFVEILSTSNFITTIGSQAISNYTFNLPTTAGGSGQYLTTDGTGGLSWGYGGSGTVTSVGLTVPSFLSVTPSSITSSGTFTVTLSGTALPVSSGGTGVTTNTGYGSVVLSNSPTLVTPTLGVATATSLQVGSIGSSTAGTGLFTTLGAVGTLTIAANSGSQSNLYMAGGYGGIWNENVNNTVASPINTLAWNYNGVGGGTAGNLMSLDWNGVLTVMNATATSLQTPNIGNVTPGAGSFTTLTASSSFTNNGTRSLNACDVYSQSSSQSVVNNTATVGLYNGGKILSSGTTGITYATGHFTNSNSFAINVTVSACMLYSGNVTGDRQIGFYVSTLGSGLDVLGFSNTVSSSSGDITGVSSTVSFPLAAGANFSVYILQNSGSTLTTFTISTLFPTLTIMVM